MGDKDSIRFLASQLVGLGQTARQDAQQAQSNALAKRYQQLAESKFTQEKNIQDQQTAVGAFDILANNKAAIDMAQAHDTDPTHLALYLARAKQDIYNSNPALRQRLPGALGGLTVPFYNVRPTPSGAPGVFPANPVPRKPDFWSNLLGNSNSGYGPNGNHLNAVDGEVVDDFAAKILRRQAEKRQKQAEAMGY